jgi:hypothetical protein
MFLNNFVKVLASITILSILAGCAVTGEPRMENVTFNGDNYTISNEALKNSISVGEVENFPGTNNFTYGGKLAPNFSDESFKEVLEKSLMNASLNGNGYVLDVKLIDSGDWSDWFESSLGEKSRKIEIEYALTNSVSKEVILSKVIESEVFITNKNPLMPYNLTQRDAAEKSYSENIRKIIEEIGNL